VVLKSNLPSSKSAAGSGQSEQAETAPQGDLGLSSGLAEYRREPLSGGWVIISRERAQRPHDIEEVVQENVGVTCPFCKGNERLATPAEATYYTDGVRATAQDPHFLNGRKRRDWQVRVIPNKYPAVEPTGLGDSPKPSQQGICESLPGFGVHEVIVESPDHVTSFGDLTARQAELTLRAYQDRLNVLAENPALRYAQVFKNVGAAGGASLEHSHSQIIATSIIPSRVQNRVRRCKEHMAETGRALVCDLLEEERRAGVRMIAEFEGLAAFCPFASRFPFEVWLTPLAQEARFESAAPARLSALSQLLQRLVLAFEQLFQRPAYNFCLDTAPFVTEPADSSVLASYHWRLEVFPRLAKAAGFEWATGDFINIVPPEEAAAQLRPFFGAPFA
jgi:UDPglucose--hexose-1-phosphate uridylyltransferase